MLLFTYYNNNSSIIQIVIIFQHLFFNGNRIYLALKTKSQDYYKYNWKYIFKANEQYY